MYSFIGLIHVLLMLTQSRFMPDLSFLLKEETTAVAMIQKPTQQHAFVLPVASAPRLSFANVRPEDKDKLKQLIQTQGKVFQHIQKIQKRNRVFVGSRLYILLGQLKTEG